MLTLGAVDARPDLSRALAERLRRHGVTMRRHPPGVRLPGSYWGAPEAGVTGDTLHVRPDTPLHSLLHEAAHVVCARAAGRPSFDGDAGGDDTEEAAVCRLQLAFAEALPGVGWRRLARDMDAWGYSFRVGSTAAWYARDAADALAWLTAHGLVAGAGMRAA